MAQALCRAAECPATGAQRLIPVMVEPEPALGPARRQEAPVYPRPRHAVITWPDGTQLEVPANYPAPALKALIAAVRRTR
jgi:hypothetical protein